MGQASSAPLSLTDASAAFYRLASAAPGSDARALLHNLAERHCAEFTASSSAPGSAVTAGTVEATFAPLIRAARMAEPALASASDGLPAARAAEFWSGFFQRVHQAAGSSAPTSAASTAPTSAAHDDEPDETLFSASNVYIHTIPQRPRAEGYRASDWNTAAPTMTASLRVVASASSMSVLVFRDLHWRDPLARAVIPFQPMDEHVSATVSRAVTEQPIEFYVEPVLDSSRYFVLRLKGAGAAVGRMGVGFPDRKVSFDFMSTLRDRVAYVTRQRFGAALLDAPAVLPVPAEAPVNDDSTAPAVTPVKPSAFALAEGASLTISSAAFARKQPITPAPPASGAPTSGAKRLAPPRSGTVLPAEHAPSEGDDEFGELVSAT